MPPINSLATASLSRLKETLRDIAQGTLAEFHSNPTLYLRKFADLPPSAFPLLENFGQTQAAVSEHSLPRPGSVVYTDLIPGHMQHSGIYVGNGQIVERNRAGEICLVGPEQFTNGGLGLRIHVSSAGDHAVGSPAIAERALAQVGKREDYHLLLNNCHQFTSGCLTGNFSNADGLLRLLKISVCRVLGAEEWMVWRFS